MKVLQVCAEIFPLLKTGGLADVCGALPAALARQGCEMRTLVPAFPAIRRGVPDAKPVSTAFGMPEGTALLRGSLPGGEAIYLIDAPQLFNREGNPYAAADGQAYVDNHVRFALLGRVAALLAEGLDGAWRPQVVHGHDWHAGLAPAYLKAAQERSGRRTAGCVYTVHNLAYQGTFAVDVMGALGLPWHFFSPDGLEYHGQVSFMKSGLVYADRVTTVSPTYAREIQGEEQGCGLDGVMRKRAADLIGILNGVDDAVWNPATDVEISQRYDVRRLKDKAVCRAELQRMFGLAPRNDAPLFAVVSRLTEQKGFNLILAGLAELVSRGGQMVVLGSGDAALVDALKQAAAADQASIGVKVGYDEPLAHRIVAGADVLMVPSRFEPCGLTQLYALKYGTLPLVRRVGGLADTVVDCSLENLADDIATGLVFDRFDVNDFNAAVRRAFALYGRPAEWRKVQKRGMAQSFGWDAAAAQYLAEYQRVAVA